MATDLEKQNQLLALQIKNLQTTLDHIGAYVFTKDLEGKYTYVNQLVRDLFGCPLEEIIGFDDSKFFSLALSNDLKINDQKVMTEGVVIEQEEKNIIAKTGEVRYYISVKKPLFDVDGNIIGMFGVSTDITERKQMEQELQNKQELLDTVLNNVDAFVYMKDRDYRYLYLNPKTADLFKMNREEILGKQEEDFLSLSEAEHFREMDKKVFQTGETQSGEEQYTTPDGMRHYYWSVKVPLKNQHGEMSSYIGISTDITELSLLRNNLQDQVNEEISKRLKQEQLLIQHSKMASMGEMMGVIIHQWKQPLSAILFLTEEITDVIAFENSDPEALNNIRERIMGQVNHMNQTANDFKNFFKPNAEIKSFVVCQQISEVYKLLEAKFKNMEIDFQLLDHEHFECVGSSNELKQVLMNIYNNACDVFEERGIRERKIINLFDHSGGVGTVRILDNSGGIPEELLPDKLFESYVSTKGENGTGIGLQMSKTIIEEKFKGKLWARNGEEGAEFVIELPLAGQAG